MKNCIAVLTRGYPDLAGYSKIIKRNVHISAQLIDKDIDCLIFHEGNITSEHQTHIQAQTPELRLIFVNVKDGHSFRKEKESIPHDEEGRMYGGMGYRHMCSFWFSEFLHFTQEYDKMLRIDEDCYIQFNVDAQFKTLDSYLFVCGRWESDDYASVTRGLLDISIQKFKCAPHILFGPYTNVTGFDLAKIRLNPTLKEYMDLINESGGIYRCRWGDLPLWGEAILHIFGRETVKVDVLHYHHESHNLFL